jgi:hypothetical protein
MSTTTIESIIASADFTSRAIALRNEAAAAGDLETVSVCDTYLNGENLRAAASAARQVARVLLVAEAQADS